VAADRDLISLEHTVKLFKALPKGQLLIVPGTSHMLFKEKPDLGNRAIIDFLGER
jgi:pimeloyl-ACP methyl ester carboxylesterase